MSISRILHSNAPHHSRRVAVGSQLLLVGAIPIHDGNIVVNTVSAFESGARIHGLVRQLSNLIGCTSTLHRQSRRFVGGLRIVLKLLRLGDCGRLRSCVLGATGGCRRRVNSLLNGVGSPIVTNFLVDGVGHTASLNRALVLGDRDRLPSDNDRSRITALVAALKGLVRGTLRTLKPRPNNRVDMALRCHRN